ncbi:hypothetical protein [Streptomyces sp. NPDC008121]|uniref:hypothetical protein n=1 Tax=Streptomyces sp. NPDC008121 TaxID=3364809 RepID=UPI0036EF8F32
MATETLLTHKGVPVPAVTGWSVEREMTPRVIGFADASLDLRARDPWKVLWRLWTLGRGKGEPEFKAVHPLRQRRAALYTLCQVCDQPAEDEERGTLFVLGANGTAGLGAIQDLELASEPPVHPRCAIEAIARCPHLRNGHVAARVQWPVPWGVRGTRYGLTRSWPKQRPEQVNVSYASEDRRLVLADRVLIELHGCQPVDLAEEARCAQLAPPERDLTQTTACERSEPA